MLSPESSTLPPSKPTNGPHRLPAHSTSGANTDQRAVSGNSRDSLRPSKHSIQFQDSEAARGHLESVLERLPAPLAYALPSLLEESPDPDSALILLERLINEFPETARLLEEHNFLAHYAIVVFGHSRFLGETLIQNPDLLQSLLRERNLDQSLSHEEFHESLARFRARSFEGDISLLLARFKRREYVRIMLRDVLKLAPLAETTAEISALADVLIEDALREAENRLQRRYEAPQYLDVEGRLVDAPFAILSLGKLGGSELNYSSDVDLLYIFGDGEEPPNTKISNHEYFVRLAQELTEILSCPTREGAVFRIDLRLRPQGNEGELAISISSALRYYAATAHDWEQQALLKIRYSAGNETLAREFIRGVQPHVYTEQVNFSAIKTALESRERMDKRRRHRHKLETPGQGLNVKLDRGGIRDIEFLVQCLQRAYGGAEPWLRSGGTLFSLQKLHDKQHISGKEFHELTSAYEFLRHLEHRLQLRQGQQTHRLPSSEQELRILQKAMEGFVPGQDRLEHLPEVVRRRMATVGEIYQRIVYQQNVQSHLGTPEAPFELRSTPEPGDADQSYRHILEQLASDAPALHQALCQPDISPHARKNLYRFLSSAFTSSERYATVVRHAAAVERATALFAASDYLTDILVRHPEEIATLAVLKDTPVSASTARLFEDFFQEKLAPKDPVFAYLPDAPASYSDKLALLRQRYRHRVLAVGAKDITECRSVYESLAATTAAAEDAISAAFGIVGAPEDLAIMALGRLGSQEFDVLSDADLLFICGENADRFALAKSAEQFMQALSAYTQDGMVFPVDARLRPRGGEGELLITPGHLENYFQREAQAWEALSYTKLRYLAGSRELGNRTCEATKILFDRYARDGNFLPDIREMRTRLDLAEAPTKNFKTSAGAVYDIDFLCGYLLVKNGISPKGGSLRDRLWRCAGAGVLDKNVAAALDHAAEFFRTVEHVTRWIAGRPQKWLPATAYARQMAEELTAKILHREFQDSLETELMETCSSVRKIFDRLVA